VGVTATLIFAAMPQFVEICNNYTTYVYISTFSRGHIIVWQLSGFILFCESDCGKVSIFVAVYGDWILSRGSGVTHIG
jgi:hypothetical protein